MSWQRLRAAAAAVVAILVAGVDGIHEDQLGRFDWYHRYLGSYSTALFSKSRSRLAVATARNSLGVLSLRTGEVEWRQVFGESDILHHVVMTEKPAAIFTLSGSGSERMLRAWNQHTGALVWDMPLCGHGAAENPGGNLVHMGPDQTDALSRALIFVTGCEEVKAVNTSTAEVAWTYSLAPGADAVHLATHPLSAALSILAVYSKGTSPRVEVAVVSVLDGQRLRGARLPFPEGLDGNQVSLVRGKTIAVSRDGSSVCEAEVVEGSEFSCKRIRQMVPQLEEDDVVALADVQPISTILLGVHKGGGAAVGHVVVDPSRGGLEAPQVKHLGGYSVTCTLPLDGGGEVIGAVGSNKEGIWWSVVDGATGEQLHHEKVAEFRRWGRNAATADGVTSVERCFLATFSRKDGGSGWRLLVVSSDSSAVLLQQGEVVWVREEALSGVTSSLAVDFPKMSGGLEGTSGLSTMQHLRKQILTLKMQMGFASPAENEELSDLRHAGSDVMLSTPDSSGLRKLLVVLSDAGKVMALHNGDGHIVWGLAYNSTCPPQVLQMWQEPHSLTVSPKVVLMRTDTPACRGYISVVDAHSGSEVLAAVPDVTMSQVLPLPYSFRTGPSEQRIFLLASSAEDGATPRAQLVPDVPETATAFAPHASSTTFWQLQERPLPAIKGFVLKQGNGNVYEVMEIWSIVFGAGSKVLAAVHRDDSSVHTRIKVLGDRSMLVKYLNPNTVFLATSQGTPTYDSESSEITIHIVDTVTGRHLFRQVHKGAAAPVTAAFCEHWVVYHYYSTIHMRHEMAVVELYDDSSARSLSLAEAIMSNSSTAISSTTPLAIKTLRQAFFFNNGAKFMGVTHTARGITAKQLLIGTSSDQVYALDKRFVDPRRPLGPPTNADKEERLAPYKPDLGLHPPFFATYDKTVAGVRGADTFPTSLESTTLMLAYGLDIFYTRLAPSKSFDMLDDDFSFALLVATLLGMGGLGVYLQVTKQRNELAKKWA